MKWIFLLLTASLFSDAPSCSCKQYEGIYGRLYSETPCMWNAEVSVLGWQAQEEGLSFALKNNPLSIPANTNINGDLVKIDFMWEPAIRLNLSAEIPCMDWDLDFRWTYFRTHSTESATLSTNANSSGLIPIWTLPNTNVATQFLYSLAHGSWNLNLNQFDFEAGYYPSLSPAMALRFHAGLKIATVNQHFRVLYSDGFNDGTNQLLSASVRFKNNTIGTGPRLGFSSQWQLGRGFSLLGSIAGSLPLWHYRISRRDFDSNLVAGSLATVDSFFKQRFWIFRPIVETSLGIGWQTWLSCFPFGISANYEFQYFAEQNMMAMLVNPGLLNLAFEPCGDLFLHGATVTFYLGF